MAITGCSTAMMTHITASGSQMRNIGVRVGDTAVPALSDGNSGFPG